jgi:hypothetical protein
MFSMRDRGLIRLIRHKTPKLTPWEIIEALRVVAAHDERGCRCGACNLAGAIEIFLDGPISLMEWFNRHPGHGIGRNVANDSRLDRQRRYH